MSIILNSLLAQSASNTFFDNNEAATLSSNKDWKIDGVTVSYGPCTRPTVHSATLCVDDVPFDYDNAGSPAFEVFNPFRLRQVVTCNPAQWVNDEASFIELNRNTFNASAHIGMAEAFWNGGDGWKGLVELAQTVSAVPASLVSAIGLLMQAMSSTGGGSGGTIHMSPYLANALVGRQLAYRRGQRLYSTVGDFLIIADGGYSGNGPGVAPGVSATDTTQWIYVTGPVYYYLDEVEFAAGFDGGTIEYDLRANRLSKYIDRRTNRLVIPCEADAIFYTNPCSVFGVPVDLKCEIACGSC